MISLVKKLGCRAIAISLLSGFAVASHAGSCIDQTPGLLSSSASLTTSGEHSSSYQTYQAFDGDNSSMWISSTWETPAWLAYDFAEPTFIEKYSIHYSNGSIRTRAPKDFELQGNNGNSWVTLDKRHNETNWAGSEERSYTVSTPGYYQEYRLLITDDNDNREDIVVISIGELTLERCSCDYASEQIPTLSANNSQVLVSGNFSSTYLSWQAFDSSDSSMWISEVWQTPAWIGYTWSTLRFVEQYAIKFANGSLTSRAPKDWQFQGWNGNSWVTVDQRSHQTNWGGSQKRHYSVANPGAYTQYRLLVLDDNDNRSGIVVVSMGDLSMRGCAL